MKLGTRANFVIAFITYTTFYRSMTRKKTKIIQVC
jgi:hypothetical protein